MAFVIRKVDESDGTFIARCLTAGMTGPDVNALAAIKKEAYQQVIRDARNMDGALLVAVEKTSGQQAAFAHWVPPHATEDIRLSRSGIDPPHSERLREAWATARRFNSEALGGRRCYLLQTMAVLPKFIGSGVDSLLLRWPFEEADFQQVPVMVNLDLDWPDSIRTMYSINGFKEFQGNSTSESDSEEIDGEELTVHMVREPNAATKFTAAILILSDTAAKDPSTDRSGQVLKDVFDQEGDGQWEIGAVEILPDDVKMIQNQIVSWTGGRAGPDASPFNLIVTTGGTGFALKDTTPEAVEPLLQKKAPGLVHLMLSTSLQVTPFAAMARPVAGVRGKTMIVTLPGSPKGAKENLQAILKLLPHACQQSAGADSRTLHSRGVKKLESDAGVGSGSEGSNIYSNPNHGNQHQHNHHHHHNHNHGPGVHHGPAGPHTRPEDRPAPNDPSLGPSARHRESPYPKLPVPEAITKIFASSPAPQTEEKAVDPDLVGSILAEDVTAPHPVPAFRASIVDGYACVTAPEGTNEKGTFPVTSVSHASPGEIAPLSAGNIARITTGAPLPPGASAVIMVEDTVLRKMSPDGQEEAEVEILTDKVKSGENVREVGSDIAAGSVVLQKGTMISAVGGELGVLAAVGRAKVKVFRKPVVGVMSTGDEIVPHDQEVDLRHGEVRDTNRIALMSAIRGWGYTTVDLGIAKDVSGSLETALRQALRQAEVIVTTGGVSMGELDLLKPTVERSLGGTIHFGRVAMKPGMPTTFATVPYKAVSGDPATALIFSLPGNPASGMVTASLFLRPCLDRMSGVEESRAGAPRIKAVLAANARSDPARAEYQRAVVWQEADGRLHAQTTGMQRSSRIASFASANCLIIIPPGQGTLDKGTVVDGMLLSGLGQAQ